MISKLYRSILRQKSLDIARQRLTRYRLSLSGFLSRHPRSGPPSYSGLLVAVLLAWAFAPPLYAAGLEASVDRTRLVEGESLLLTLTGPGDLWGTPDTGPLNADFQVQNQGQGTSTLMTNGRVSTTREWRFLLSPKSTGHLTIPALKLGDLASLAIAIEVVPASQAARVGEAPAARLEAELDRDSVYVQGQAVYTLRILLRPQVQNASLEDPKAEDVQFERLGEDQVSEILRDGQRYQVIERRYAILPQRSGPIEIQAPLLSAAVPESRQRGGQAPGSPFASPFAQGQGPFEPFFGRDPFAEMGSIFQRTRPIQVRGPTLTLNVQPQPAAASSPWLPAESIQLAETWTPDPSKARVGEPLSRTIAITAQGVNAAQLPDLSTRVPDSIKLYPDKPRSETRAEGNALISIKEIKQALVPAVAGTVTLPEIRLAWWDTREDTEKVAVLPERTLEVLPAVGSAADRQHETQIAPVTPATSATTAPFSPDQSSQSSLNPMNSASAPSGQATNPPLMSPQHAAVPATQGGDYWPWLGSGLALAWLATLLLWWRERRQRLVKRNAPHPGTPALAQSDLSAALEGVRQACLTGNARQARQALVAWGQARWPDEPPPRLEPLAARLGGEAADWIRRLDQHLYADGALAWDGPTAWHELEAILGATQRPALSRQKRREDPLPPLYTGRI